MTRGLDALATHSALRTRPQEEVFQRSNAKSETVFTSPLYRDLIVRRGCVVPLSGFSERKREGTSKWPFKIDLKDEPIMSVAGIWDGSFSCRIVASRGCEISPVRPSAASTTRSPAKNLAAWGRACMEAADTYLKGKRQVAEIIRDSAPKPSSAWRF